MAESALLPTARAGFTLIELLVVIGIIVVLMVLVAPAFNTMKQGTDLTVAASKLKGVLDQARTYAMSNNTYTWVGFFEEDAGTTTAAVAGNGRLVLSTVASADGTNLATGGILDATKLLQVGKLVKIENVHLPLFQVGDGTADDFDHRPAVQSDPVVGYNDSRFGEINSTSSNTAPTTMPNEFQYPVGNPTPTRQYRFQRLLQFNPRGENRINGNTYDIRRVVEIGLVPTRGNSVPAPISGAGTSTAIYSGNVAALQINGFSGNTKIYRR